jgi:hypothetical protein
MRFFEKAGTLFAFSSQPQETSVFNRSAHAGGGCPIRPKAENERSC